MLILNDSLPRVLAESVNAFFSLDRVATQSRGFISCSPLRFVNRVKVKMLASAEGRKRPNSSPHAVKASWLSTTISRYGDVIELVSFIAKTATLSSTNSHIPSTLSREWVSQYSTADA